MGLFNDDMTGLAAAYASMNDGKYLLTNADKVGNTPAWQNRYKVNESTGEMLYEMADHLKESYEEELIAKIDATLEELRRLDEGKIPAGLQAYLDKKKGKKGNGDKKEEENGNGKDHGNGNGNGSKGSKPDFLDLDKDGDKKEPMKKAAKEKKEETEYNYVNAYAEMMAPRMQKGAMAYDGPNKPASEAKDRVMQKTKEKQAKMKEENVILDSGIFTEGEIAKFLWVEFDEGYQRNPEKDPQNKPYKEKSKAERMADPERGINSPAFKKFMADRGM
jgi:hypothetical protein